VTHSDLHVVQIGFFLDREGRAPAQLLCDWWPLVDTAEIVARTGARVTVIQACAQSATVVQGGVTYFFMARPRKAPTLAETQDFIQLLQRLHPDVLHVHGLGFPAEVMALARARPRIPILLQDHADGVPRFWRRRAHARAMARVAGVSFCALEQAKPFRRAALIKPHTAVFGIPECSSRFVPGDRAAARVASGLFGDPALLWVGHLDANKDPLTVLEAVAEASESLPQLQLFCCFGKAPLLAEVERCIAGDRRLRGRVHLLGKVSHARVELLMQGADLFVLGSHHEGSGCSLIEALACGLSPLVTDIPSYRALTGQGSVGKLWSCGQPAELCRALLSMASRASRLTRESVRAHFDRELSFEAAGGQWRAAYENLMRGDVT